MKMAAHFFSSSIGKKYIMGFSGACLCVFILIHLLGNLLIYLGPETFNLYAHKLISNPFLPVAEVALATIALVHIFMGTKLTFENIKAKGKRYYVGNKTGRGATLASSTMPYTGTFLLIFIVSHIIHMKYGTHYAISYGEEEIRDLYRLVFEIFSSLGYVCWYVISMFLLSVHLFHGVQSIFQSFGLVHSAYTPFIKKMGFLFGTLIFLGLTSIPVWLFFQNGVSV